jgi:ATP-dependent helicase/nuclease subunit A
LQMSPLTLPATPEQLSAGVLASLSRGGFSEVLRQWLHSLADLNSFHAHRYVQLQRLCSGFDETGVRDVDVFRRYLESARLAEGGAGQVVQVMTIHKSKGLGFDVVFLPDLESDSLAGLRSEVAVSRDSQGEVEWILSLPPKMIVECDPMLSAMMEDLKASECFERMCLLYVAMTRAKHGLYITVAGKPDKRSDSANYVQWLRQTLADSELQTGDEHGHQVWRLYQKGEPDWFQKLALPALKLPTAAVTVPDFCSGSEGSAVFAEPHSPSKVGEETEKSYGFRSNRNQSSQIGTETHQLLSQIQWLTDGEPILSQLIENESAAALLLKQCLTAPEIAGLFRTPEYPERYEVWNEQAFELVKDDRWISGVFDRVVLETDSSGGYSAATLIDFKTDLLNPWDPNVFLQRHRPQMQLYRSCLAQLVSLPETRIQLILVAIRRGECVKVVD